jgi:hypothetical protein
MRALAKSGVLILLSILLSNSAHAHHSFAMFDENLCLSVSGVVKKYKWAYPHMWLWVSSEDSDNKHVLWGFEGGDPASLAVNGWNAKVLKKGDKITVMFNPLRDGRQGGSLRQIVLPNGENLAAQVSGSSDEKYFKTCKSPS